MYDNNHFHAANSYVPIYMYDIMTLTQPGIKYWVQRDIDSPILRGLNETAFHE